MRDNRGAAHAAGSTPILAETVDAARRGDDAAWTLLFDRFHPDVYAYALARLHDSVAAEEVMQDVFVAAVRSIGSLRERREPAVQAWFLHICRHKVIDHQRRAARDARRPTHMPSPVADPSELVADRFRAASVRRALETLTEDQRDILVRRFVLDLSLEDVAAGTGRSVGAVKSLQHRALRSLARLLDRESAA